MYVLMRIIHFTMNQPANILPQCEQYTLHLIYQNTHIPPTTREKKTLATSHANYLYDKNSNKIFFSKSSNVQMDYLTRKDKRRFGRYLESSLQYILPYNKSFLIPWSVSKTAVYFQTYKILLLITYPSQRTPLKCNYFVKR